MESEILSLNQLDRSKRYTYADYYQWKLEDRVELIDGYIYEMSAADWGHQKVSKRLTIKMNALFESKQCKLFVAPYDVRLPDSPGQTDDKEVFNVVQPDLGVICDPGKIDYRGCIGAPDLVIEILSPGNVKKEAGIKFKLYEEKGVKEYWLVHPELKIILVYSLKNGKYTGKLFSEEDEIRSVLYPELKFIGEEVFDRELFERAENIAQEPPVAYLSEILSLDQLDLSKRYSYADYFRWKFEERVELIKGFIHKMSAPSRIHQKISHRLTMKIGAFFEDKRCELYAAPFDVRLPDYKKQISDETVFTVVQPDLCVICSPDKMDDRGCIGAPDLVIEILSPGNTKKEIGIKFKLYEENEVKEYWLINPKDKVIIVNILRNGQYIVLAKFTEDDDISSYLFPDLKFAVKDIFEDKKLV